VRLAPGGATLPQDVARLTGVRVEVGAALIENRALAGGLVHKDGRALGVFTDGMPTRQHLLEPRCWCSGRSRSGPTRRAPLTRTLTCRDEDVSLSAHLAPTCVVTTVRCTVVIVWRGSCRRSPRQYRRTVGAECLDFPLWQTERHIRLPGRGRPERFALCRPAPWASPFDQFLATAEVVAQARPEVDLEMAREGSMRRRLCSPTASPLTLWTDTTLAPLSLGCASISLLRIPAPRCARSHATLEAPGDLHDPEGVSAAYLIAAAILQL
jgi:hypothetical protein